MAKNKIQYPTDLCKKLKSSLARDELSREIARRMNILLDFYKFDDTLSKDVGLHLAVHLILDHIVGFQVEKQRGAPKKQDKPKAKEARRELIEKVDAMKIRRPGMSDNAISKQLVKDPALPIYFSKAKSNTLRAAIRMARQEQQARDRLLAAILSSHPDKEAAADQEPEKKFES